MKQTVKIFMPVAERNGDRFPMGIKTVLADAIVSIEFDKMTLSEHDLKNTEYSIEEYMIESTNHMSLEEAYDEAVLNDEAVLINILDGATYE